jgi:signal transduction histidine kinase
VKKIALLFVLAVLAPSLVLAWLAVRSLKDQELIFERQQELLYQAESDALAEKVRKRMLEKQLQFGQQVEGILADRNPRELAPDFDEMIRAAWPSAEVGFAVTLEGSILAPSLVGGREAKAFRLGNESFLSNTIVAEVYPQQVLPGNKFSSSSSGASSPSSWQIGDLKIRKNTPPPAPAFADDFAPAEGEADTMRERKEAAATASPQDQAAGVPMAEPAVPVQIEKAQETMRPSTELDKAAKAGRSDGAKKTEVEKKDGGASVPAHPLNLVSQREEAPAAPAVLPGLDLGDQLTAGKGGNQSKNRPISRVVTPQKESIDATKQALSQLAPEEAEFRQIVGEAMAGSVARFVQNKLSILLWHRSPRDPQLVFGAQLKLSALERELADLLRGEKRFHETEVCLALINDKGKPVAQSLPGFSANWKQPFVATEIGEGLPHWEAAVYLVNPAQLSRTAGTVRLMLGLMVGVLLAAMAAGGWLIAADVRRQVRLARQKTDFVSNVSHELKTPLTSIRMFSELLAEERVEDPQRRRDYLRIITAEASRLTRLINNVLDFARMERGEKKYDLRRCRIDEVAEETLVHYRPHLEASGFSLEWTNTAGPVESVADRDAIAQVLVNLLSNAEKYSGERKEIGVELKKEGRRICLAVADRGLGIPPGCEGKIFDQFYRAHDSLGSGIQGAGLGLSLARQIARAHGGEVRYEPREGGGSRFVLELPLAEETLKEGR